MVWKAIYDKLKDHGLSVYSPGQHEGICTERYVVVKSSGVSKIAGISSTNATYDIMCYIPKEEYSDLEDFVKSVKAIMKELMMMKPTYLEVPFFDEAKQAHMVSIEYANTRKI